MKVYVYSFRGVGFKPFPVVSDFRTLYRNTQE